VLQLLTLFLSGKFDLWSFFAGILLSLVILAFPFFRYVPALEGMPVKPFGKAPATETQKKEGQAKEGQKAKPEEQPQKPKPRKKKEVS
jgi:hypothetical protein